MLPACAATESGGGGPATSCLVQRHGRVRDGGDAMESSPTASSCRRRVNRPPRDLVGSPRAFLELELGCCQAHRALYGQFRRPRSPLAPSFPASAPSTGELRIFAGGGHGRWWPATLATPCPSLQPSDNPPQCQRRRGSRGCGDWLERVEAHCARGLASSSVQAGRCATWELETAVPCTQSTECRLLHQDAVFARLC